MRYLLFLVLLMVGCTDSNSITADHVNKCSTLANTFKFTFYITDMGTCVIENKLKHTAYAYYIPNNQVEGALRMSQAFLDMKNALAKDNCIDKCKLKIESQKCQGDKFLALQECQASCSDAE